MANDFGETVVAIIFVESWLDIKLDVLRYVANSISPENFVRVTTRVPGGSPLVESLAICNACMKRLYSKGFGFIVDGVPLVSAG
ncbi:MAG: hypothetical protein ACD_39C01207G0002 [uncultured bacterium]|nr:MAG: hypothetical protein ACD_39C01207G0002 [uncultured bacterium]